MDLFLPYSFILIGLITLIIILVYCDKPDPVSRRPHLKIRDATPHFRWARYERPPVTYKQEP